MIFYSSEIVRCGLLLSGLTFLPFSERASHHRSSSSSLTLHPEAESVPGLAQVFTGAVVHDTHVSKATLGTGIGGRVRHPGLVYPASSTHVQPALQRPAGPADTSLSPETSALMGTIFSSR